MKKPLSFALLILASQTASAGLPPTTSKGSGDASDITTFKYQFPNFAVTHTGTTVSLGVLGTSGGGTGNTTGTATNVNTTQTTTNASYFPLMVASSTNGSQAPNLGTNFSFNPSTNILSLGSGGLFSSTNGTETVACGMSSSSRFTCNNSTHANSAFFGYATNGGNVWLGNGTNTNSWTAALNGTSTSTNISTGLVPNAITAPIFMAHNDNATASNFGAFGFSSAASDKMTSAMVGVTEVHTAGSETGHLEFWTNNAGTKAKAMQINANKTIALPGYTAGVLQADASGNITSGGSVGGGSKNYISTNPDIELASTTGFSLGHVALTNGLPSGSPTFGSGNAGTLSLGIETASPIAPRTGGHSLNYVSSAATTAGDFVATDPFEIDNEGQAKALQFKISYQAAVNPTNGNFSGTSSNSFGVALYDATNSSFIPCSGAWNVVQSSGVGIASGICQTNSTTASARLLFYNVSASSGAITMKLDNWSYGPQVSSSGPPMDDFVAYTPTFQGFGTPTNVNISSRRNGDSLEVQGTFTTGTSTAVEAEISLGYNGANANVTSASTYPTLQVVGKLDQNFAATTYFGQSVLIEASKTYLTVGIQSSTTNELTKANGNDVAGTGKIVSFFARVKIQGWSSNTVQSADSDQRVVAARYRISSNFTASATTPINFDTKIIDTAGAVTTSATAWKFLAPSSGVYRVSTVSVITSGSVDLLLYKNGSPEVVLSTSSATATYGGAQIVQLNANDYIDIRPSSSAIFNSANSGQYVQVSIEKLSGSAVVQATETVAARYTTSSTNSATSLTTMVFTSKDYDTHNAYNTTTGLFTCPAPGKYQVNTSVYTNPASSSAVNNTWDLNVRKNGATGQYCGDYSYIVTGVAVNANLKCTQVLRCNAGDTLDVSFVRTNNITGVALTGSSDNYVEFLRVGN